MTGYRLRNNYLKVNREKQSTSCKTKKQICVSFKKCYYIKKYYRNLDQKKIADNRWFWKTIKPLFSDKSVSRDRIGLLEKKEIVKSESETEKTYNNLFKFHLTKILMKLQKT